MISPGGGAGAVREVALGPGPCPTWSEGQVLATGFRASGRVSP